MDGLTSTIFSAGALVLALAAAGCDNGGNGSQTQGSEYGGTQTAEQAPATRQPAPGTQPAATECDAQAAGFAVGQAATDELVDRARQAAGAKAVRVIAPGTAVTMDFRSDRLNLETDAANVVTAVKCG